MRWAYELQERYPPDPDAPTGVPQVLRTGEPEFFPEIPQELLDEAIGDDEELRRDHRRARAAVDDLRAADRARADARRADADRGRDAPAVHAGRPRAGDRARAPRRGRGRQRPALPRGRARRRRGAGARLRRRRRRRSLDTRRPRAPLEPGRGVDHRRRRGATRSAGWSATSCRPGTPLTSHVPLVPPGGAARPVTVPIVLGGRERWVVRLRRRLRRRHRLRAPGRDRGARAREDAQRLRRHRLARAAHAARRGLRRRAHAAARRRRARPRTTATSSSR